MKFILVLTALALVTGTGLIASAQQGGNKFVPGQQATIPMPQGAVEFQYEDNPQMAAVERRIGLLQAALYSEEAALQQATADHTTNIHLGPEAVHTILYGMAAKWIYNRTAEDTNDFANLRRVTNKLVKRSNIDTDAAAAEAADAENWLAKLPPYAQSTVKVLEGVGTVAAVVFFGEQVYETTNDFVTVHFRDTDEMKQHTANIKKARQDLESAKQNLRAYFYSTSSPKAG